TGISGFVGSFLGARLFAEGSAVAGIDNLNDYYDPALKNLRLASLKALNGSEFFCGKLAKVSFVNNVFQSLRPRIVVHLGAQAGVRYSLQTPRIYVDSNVVGFLNILESCRLTHLSHLVYASTNSYYGANPKLPFSTKDIVDHPISLYAATKKSNERMARAYAHLYGLAVTGLRFFTVYGPWDLPVMAYFAFTRRILAGETIVI